MADIVDMQPYFPTDYSLVTLMLKNMFYVQVFYKVIAFLLSYFVVENFGENEY